MKVVLLSVIITCLSGCFSKDEAKPSPDYFSKKKECAEWFDKVKKRFEEANQKRVEALNFANRSKVQRFSISFLDEACYSSRHNSCIGFVRDLDRILPAKGDILEEGESRRVVDLLTNQTLASDTLSYLTETREDAIKYATRVQASKDNAQCVR